MNSIRKTIIITKINRIIHNIYKKNNIEYQIEKRVFNRFGGPISYSLLIPENADDHTYESYKTHVIILKKLIANILDDVRMDKNFLNSCERVNSRYE